MINILDRTNVMNKNSVNGRQELDLSSSFTNFGSFDFGEDSWTTIHDTVKCRPDLISFRIYRTDALWWFICWYNGFMDPFHDIQPEVAVKFPTYEKVIEGIRYASEKASKHTEG